MTLGEHVSRKLADLWPDLVERARVLAELGRYGRETHEPEPERVRLAILRLCEARADKVADLVAAAKRDYRDVLMWAEYPGEGRAVWATSGNLSPEERSRLEELRRQDREQYREWLER